MKQKYCKMTYGNLGRIYECVYGEMLTKAVGANFNMWDVPTIWKNTVIEVQNLRKVYLNSQISAFNCFGQLTTSRIGTQI